MGSPFLKYLLHAILFVRDWLFLRIGTCGDFIVRWWRSGRERRQICDSYSSDEEDHGSYWSQRTYGSRGNESEEEDQCYICLEPKWYSSVTRLLSCTHNDRFHVSCLWKWVMENSVTDFSRYGVLNVSCPICRTSKIVQVCNVSNLNRRR